MLGDELSLCLVNPNDALASKLCVRRYEIRQVNRTQSKHLAERKHVVGTNEKVINQLDAGKEREFGVGIGWS